MSLWVKFGFDDVRSQASWIKDLYGTHASPNFTLFLVLNMIGYGKLFHFSRLWKNDNASFTLFLLLSGLRVRRLKERKTGNLFFCCLCSCFRFVLYFISSLLLNFVCSIAYLLFTDICQFIYQFLSARSERVAQSKIFGIFRILVARDGVTKLHMAAKMFWWWGDGWFGTFQWNLPDLACIMTS